jgi:Double zinc ribbon
VTEQYIVPSIYTDISDQNQGYFAFRFTCRHCYWEIETKPVRSKVSTATNVMDLGVGMLNGFWGRAAEMGEKVYGSKWHQEQAEALQKAWAEVKPNFHFCPKCSATVCTRCFNLKLNQCVNCAPDLKVDGANFQHGLNIEAQREQIQQNYRAPQFNVNAIPSAATDDIIMQPAPMNPYLAAPGGGAAQLPMGASAFPAPPVPPSPASIAGFSTPGYPESAACPNCRKMGVPGKFCQDCGTKIPLPNLFCPKCSVPVETTARFCAECGTKLNVAG